MTDTSTEEVGNLAAILEGNHEAYKVIPELETDELAAAKTLRALAEERDALAEDNARLREALTKIRGMDWRTGDVFDASTIAHVALARTEGGG